MVIFPKIQKIKTFHDIPGVTNCSRNILFESRNLVGEFKYLKYDVDIDDKGHIKWSPTGEIKSFKTSVSKYKPKEFYKDKPAWVKDAHYAWDPNTRYRLNTIFNLDYMNACYRYGELANQPDKLVYDVPIIIINRSEMIKTNYKTKSRELEISTNIYLGTCHLRYVLDNSNDSVKMDANSQVVITNSHYVNIYKQLDDFGSSYINLENYSSFDHNPNHKKRERWIMNNQDKRMNFFDPSPKYYNQEHQIKATGGNDESFIYKSLNSPKGVIYTLGELMDENTTLGRMYIKIERLIEMADKIQARGDSYFAPDVLIYQLYQIFAQIKYDLDGHCATSADVILSTNNGWNIRNIVLGSDNLYKDMKLRKEIINDLMIAINGRYENFFKPFMSIGYEFDLYMHISLVNNNMRVVFKEAKGTTHVGLDGIIEEINTNSDTNERRGY